MVDGSVPGLAAVTVMEPSIWKLEARDAPAAAIGSEKNS